ncbi:unnamed protein product [Cuscuta europaea]|uniref:Uncharacterized protein n=1 Tax=Cuscuta europaea TaxID=41803 RepID=A0A9P1E653_CUSEU|nr:unnamed protein product [Cuscuta europaea]
MPGLKMPSRDGSRTTLGKRFWNIENPMQLLKNTANRGRRKGTAQTQRRPNGMASVLPHLTIKIGEKWKKKVSKYILLTTCLTPKSGPPPPRIAEITRNHEELMAEKVAEVPYGMIASLRNSQRGHKFESNLTSRMLTVAFQKKKLNLSLIRHLLVSMLVL